MRLVVVAPSSEFEAKADKVWKAVDTGVCVNEKPPGSGRSPSFSGYFYHSLIAFLRLILVALCRGSKKRHMKCKKESGRVGLLFTIH